MEVNIHQAKTHLSRLLQRVAEGEEVVIARAGAPIARLVRIPPEQTSRPLGMDDGAVVVAEDFDAPLPAELMEQFLGGRSKSSSRPTKIRKRRKS
ncbi:MAG: type II toxin-antitoxin system prevent-host-death family antitoxin [Candidatus Acidiferrales bacterium]